MTLSYPLKVGATPGSFAVPTPLMNQIFVPAFKKRIAFQIIPAVNQKPAPAQIFYIPRIITLPEAYITGEYIAKPEDSAFDMDQATVTIKKVHILKGLSDEYLRFSLDKGLSFYRASAEAIANKIEQGILAGKTVNGFPANGLAFTTNAQTVTRTPAYDNVIDAIAKLNDKNYGDPSTTVVVTSPTEWATLRKVAGALNDHPIMPYLQQPLNSPDPAVKGVLDNLRWYTSSLMPANTTVVADMSVFEFYYHGNVEIKRGFIGEDFQKNLSTWIIEQYCSWVALDPNAICVIS